MYRVFFLGNATQKKHDYMGAFPTFRDAYRAKEEMADALGVDGWWFTVEYE